MKCHSTGCDLDAVYGDVRTGMVLCQHHKPVPDRVLCKRFPIQPPIKFRKLPTVDKKRKVTPKPSPPPLPTIKCHVDGCNASATFGYMAIKAAYCRAHRLITLGYTPCAEPGCLTRPAFGFEKGTHCGLHRHPGMRNTAAPGCQVCAATATYRTSPTARPSVCANHRTVGEWYKVRNQKRCMSPECTKVALYGWDSRIFCQTHRIKDMARVRYVCMTEGCHMRSTYGFSNPQSCKVHKQDGMKYVFYLKDRCGDIQEALWRGGRGP